MRMGADGKHAPVARWPGLRARALGAREEEAVPECEARSTTGGDGVDVELWALDRDPSSSCFEDMFEGTTEPADVCRCASHIETDDGGRAIIRSSGEADDTT